MVRQHAPRLWSIALTFLVTLWVLEDISRQVSAHPLTICLTPLAGIVVIIDYYLRLILSASPGEWNVYWEQGAGKPRGAWRWLVLPCALAIVLSAMANPWPMTLRFSLSQAAFEQKVAEVLADRSEQGVQRVGLYWVDRIAIGPEGGNVQFMTGVSIADPVGFEYDPQRPESHPYRRHITGNWYATEW